MTGAEKSHIFLCLSFFFFCYGKYQNVKVSFYLLHFKLFNLFLLLGCGSERRQAFSPDESPRTVKCIIMEPKCGELIASGEKCQIAEH